MRTEMAEARGKVTVRPWRTGLLIDTKSRVEVREAIVNLSSVWGGRSMPIFDKNTGIESLEKLGEMFDVDAMYAENAEGPLTDFLRRPGWGWRGGGPWGPFGEEGEERFRTGLLPLREIIDPVKLVQPVWSPEDPADLVLAALWGLPDKIGAKCMRLPLSEFLPRRDLGAIECALLAKSMVHTDAGTRTHHRGNGDGIFILKPDLPDDIVAFWNARAFGCNVIGIPSEGDPDLVNFLLSQPFPRRRVTIGGEDREVVYITGADKASAEVTKAIEAAAHADGLVVQAGHPEVLSSFIFEGLDTDFTKTVRVDFRPEAHGVDVDLPQVPLTGSSRRSFMRGIVAAEVELREIRGQDPRFTAQIPPYRRHAALLQDQYGVHGADHVRSRYEGVVFGLDATSEHLRFPFSYCQDVLGLLFDNKAAKISQSDVGKFQTRAAERFGGPYSGTFNQTGVRAAVTLAAGKAAGITLPHLRNSVENNRGNWPHPVMDSDMTPQEYATRAVNHLFHSGLFVPTLRVHCSHCRVDSYVSVEGLGPSMMCEFCGQTYNLALSHSLALPEWRYRLAAHLRADQIEALLPALATTSVLQQLRHAEGSPPLVLGFEITLEGRAVEADIATYLAEREWLAVLGEVKTANRIDAKDIANLEFLRTKLAEKNVRSLLLFATLKAKLSPEERQDLRALVERSTMIRTSSGQSSPSLPLVLTGPDLSHTWWDEDHPWRWEKRSHNGIFDTALISCERNLGLISYTTDEPNGAGFLFTWAD
ncbi:hypothetical protein [Pseudarthrobacter enclensis]|uniref:hypothetical protein n=1 Tax=Pseudarthrobacter enclensis TaxID=993070 RepID=UPI003EDF33FF